MRKADPPCEDTVIDIAFEHRDTGSRIRVVQRGFDAAFVRRAGEAFWFHAEEIFADFELFFRVGVIARRAWRPWTFLGLGTVTESYGVRIAGVAPGSWAERIGLRADDVALTIGGAPVYATRDLAVVERLVRAGEGVRATWVRGGVLMEGAARA